MFKKISTVLLSLLIAVYAASQVQGARITPNPDAIRILPQEVKTENTGKDIDGEIRITAALREMREAEEITVRFVLYNAHHTYRTSVLVTPASRDEEGMLSAAASFENLLSGSYTARIEYISGADLDYILIEDSGRSKYIMRDESITFYLSENANTGSAWFILEEKEGEAL